MASKYYLRPPKQQRFYRFLIISMYCLALGKPEWWKIHCKKDIQVLCVIHGYLTLIFAPFAIISMLAFVFSNYHELTFTTLCTIFAVMPVCFVAVVKLISAQFKSYEKLMTTFMDKIHVYSYYIRERDDFIKSTLLKVEKYTRRTSYFLILFLTIAWSSWAIAPIVHNYMKKQHIHNRTIRLQTCLHLWTPFDYAYDYQKWSIVHLISSYISGGGCVLIATFDTIHFAFFFNLLGHMDILKHFLTTGFSKEMSSKKANLRLVKIIKYHTFIIETFREVQSAFGINVAASYLQNFIEDSLVLYQMMFGGTSQKVSYGVMIIIYLGSLILMSFVLEEVRKKSDDLALQLYYIPWEDMSVCNQKIYMLILLKVQPTLSFKAAGGLEAGVKPMMSIIKSTFSYYLMLKSTVTE